MKPEKQVSSLEPSMKLKELGVKQESLFYWQQEDKYQCPRTYECWFMGHTGSCKSKIVWTLKRGTNVNNNHTNAYTVAELGEMLPDGVKVIINTSRGINRWYCEAEHIPKALRERLHLTTGKTEADARAKMLIYLLENKLITL